MKKIEWISECCSAEVKLSEPTPDFFGDDPKNMKVGTCHFICKKCGKDCNVKDVKEGWTEYESEVAKRFYQKTIKIKGMIIALNIYEYEYKHPKLPTNWELEIQIREELSVVKNTMNVIVFPYDKLDFNKIERDGRKIISKLSRI